MPGSSRLARLLQATGAAQLAAAVAWFAWRWPAAPAQAIAGAALVVFIAPLVLGVEFAMLAAISRTDPGVPVPSVGQLCRAWWSETVHMFHTFWWRQPFRWKAEADYLGAECAGRDGVVLVHGFMCNRGFWNAWMRALRARGHAYVAVNLEPVFGPIDAYVPIIDAAVGRVREATGRPPVLVCHSMGGLAARAWWRARPEGAAARIVTIGTPHRGTWLGRFSRRANVRQMHLASAWLDHLGRAEAARPLPPATCWYSNCDNVVFPTSTATLPGADNRFVAGEPHVALAFHPDVMRGTLESLERGPQAPSR